MLLEQTSASFSDLFNIVNYVPIPLPLNKILLQSAYADNLNNVFTENSGYNNINTIETHIYLDKTGRVVIQSNLIFALY